MKHVLSSVVHFQTSAFIFAAATALAIGTPSRADDFTTIVQAVASPFADKPEDLNKVYTDTAIMLRLEIARHRLTSLPSSDHDLSAAKKRLLPHLDACHRAIEEMRRLDNKMPDFEKLAMKTIQAAPAISRRDPSTGELTDRDKRAVNDLAGALIGEGITMIADRIRSSIEYGNLIDSYRLARTDALSLASVAEKRCNGRSATEYGVGLNVTFGKVSIVIDEVLANSPAARAGLQPGDEVVAVAGNEVRKRVGDKLVVDQNVFHVLRGPRGTPVKLTYSRKGVQKTVELRRDLSIENPVLEVDLNSSWNAIFLQDHLALRNVSGSDLTNCTLLVELRGAHGDSEQIVAQRHLHFAERWPAGEWRYALYPSSSSPGMASGESVDRISELTVKLFSDQFAVAIPYAYTRAAAEQDCARYTDKIADEQKFTVDFVSENLIYNAGVSISHSGIVEVIPDPEITATVTQGRIVKKQKWRSNGKPWKSGSLSRETLRDPDFNGMQPDRIELELRFPGSPKPIKIVKKFSG